MSITHHLEWNDDHWDIILKTAKNVRGDAVLTLDEFLELADELKTDLLLDQKPARQRPTPRRQG